MQRYVIFVARYISKLKKKKKTAPVCCQRDETVTSINLVTMDIELLWKWLAVREAYLSLIGCKLYLRQLFNENNFWY